MRRWQYVAVLTILTAAQPARAQTFQWTGGAGTGNWGDYGNWQGNVAPSGSITTSLLIAGTSGLAMNNDVDDPLTLNRLTFDSSAGAFDVKGGSLSFAGTATALTTDSASNIRIANDITSLTSPLTLSGGGSGSLTLSGLLSGSMALNKTGSSRVILTQANTFTGGVTITGGALQIQNSAALGKGSTYVASGGVLELAGGITLNPSFSMGAGGILRNVSGNNTLSPPLGGANFGIGGDARIESLSGSLALDSFNAYVNGNGHTVTFDGAGSTTIGLTGTGTSLVKEGTGTVYLGYSTDYTGTTQVNAGTLSLNLANGGVFASNIIVASGATLLYGGSNPNQTVTINATINGDGFGGGGAIRTSGSNNWGFGGQITLASDSRFNVDSGSFRTTAAITGIGKTLTLGGAGENLISGTINLGAAGSVVKDGTGSVSILSAFSPSFNGSVNIKNGTLRIGDYTSATANPSPFLNGNAVILSGASAAAPGILVIDASSSANSALNIGSLSVNGFGTVMTYRTATTAGAISTSFAGKPVTLNGTLTWNVAGNVTGGSGLGNDVLTLGNATLTGNSTLSPTGDASNVTNIRIGAISESGGSFSLTKAGGGNLRFDGANTYTGATILNQGTLTVGGTGSFSPTSSVQFNVGSGTTATLDIASQTQAVGSLASTGAGTATVAIGTGTLTIGGDNTSSTYGGILTGSGTLIKTGSGTQTLSGTASTFTGNTNLNGGTLSLTGTLGTGTLSSPTSAGVLTVNSGGKLAGSGQVLSSASGGAIVLNSGGSIDPGVNGIGTLSATSLTWNGGGTMNFDLDLSSAASDQISLSTFFNRGTSGPLLFAFTTTGALTAPRTYTLVTYNSNGPNAFSPGDLTYAGLPSGLVGAFSYNANGVTFQVSVQMPEPSTLFLGGFALLPFLSPVGVRCFRKERAKARNRMLG